MKVILLENMTSYCFFSDIILLESIFILNHLI